MDLAPLCRFIDDIDLIKCLYPVHDDWPGCFLPVVSDWSVVGVCRFDDPIENVCGLGE